MTFRCLALVLVWCFAGNALAQNGVGPSKAEKEAKPSLDEKWARLLGDEFAFDFYQATLKGREKKSFCCSPYSAMAALAMLSHGTTGTGRDEFTKLWPVSSHPSADAASKAWSSDRLLAGFESLHTALRTPKSRKAGDRADPTELEIANCIWVDRSFPLKPGFVDAITKYGANIEAADFSGNPSGEVQRINTWCGKQTRGKIEKVLDDTSITIDTKLMLVNAVYFNAAWLEPFEKGMTKQASFHLLNGRTQMVAMMRDGKSAKYAEIRPDGSLNRHVLRPPRSGSSARSEWVLPDNPDGFKVLELPYKCERFSMVLILPNKRDGLAELESKLDRERFESWRRKPQKEFVVVDMPRFKLESSFDLKPILKSLGLTAIFRPGTLLGFSDSPESKVLSVYPAIQKTYIDVNEEGTEAAAVTALGGAGGGGPSKPPPEFIADHPFLYLIRDDQTGAILFIGRFIGET